MVTLAVIPARGGSKGLPGKHLRLIGGEPMIVLTIRAALEARRIDRVLVSTDDEAIARVARRAGAEAPFLRPAALARDDTPTLPVIRHAVDWMEARDVGVETVVTLQPTAPLREAAQIDATVALLAGDGIRSAATVAPLGLAASVVGGLVDGRFVPAAASGADSRRQAAPPAVRLTGGVYATQRLLLDEGRLLDDRPAALIVDDASAIDVDTAEDLAAARRALRARRRRRK